MSSSTITGFEIIPATQFLWLFMLISLSEVGFHQWLEQSTAETDSPAAPLFAPRPCKKTWSSYSISNVRRPSGVHTWRLGSSAAAPLAPLPDLLSHSTPSWNKRPKRKSSSMSYLAFPGPRGWPDSCSARLCPRRHTSCVFRDVHNGLFAAL